VAVPSLDKLGTLSTRKCIEGPGTAEKTETTIPALIACLGEVQRTKTEERQDIKKVKFTGMKGIKGMGKTSIGVTVCRSVGGKILTVIPEIA